ncbi:hypothetical protein HSRCO_1783 [Halanaeroarchaeum sp. HSR-CO]|nr:hypothetical protein HSRCO_1783 [Halanaeroarchaeum sp. HSR-CO]
MDATGRRAPGRLTTIEDWIRGTPEPSFGQLERCTVAVPVKYRALLSNQRDAGTVASASDCRFKLVNNSPSPSAPTVD